MTSQLEINRSNPKTSLSCQVMYSTRPLKGFCGSDWFFQHIPKMLDWSEISKIWRRSQQLKLVVVFLKLFLNQFCSVAGCIILTLFPCCLTMTGIQYCRLPLYVSLSPSSPNLLKPIVQSSLTAVFCCKRPLPCMCVRKSGIKNENMFPCSHFPSSHFHEGMFLLAATFIQVVYFKITAT